MDFRPLGKFQAKVFQALQATTMALIALTTATGAAQEQDAGTTDPLNGRERPGMPSAAPMHYSQGLDALEKNPAALRDAQGRLLFNANGLLALQSDNGAGKPAKAGAAEAAQIGDRVIIRLAPASGPVAQGAAAAPAFDVGQLVQENGGDWKSRRSLASKAPMAQAKAQRSTGAAEDLQEKLQRTFSVPVSNAGAVTTLIKALKAAPGVEFAQPSFKYSASVVDDVAATRAEVRKAVGSAGAATAQSMTTPQSTEAPWGIDSVRARQAWKATRGQGVVVAVVDTGVNRLHQQLRDNMWKNEREIPNNCIDDDGNGYIDDVNGWSFADEFLARYEIPVRVPQTCPGDVAVFNETMDFDWHGSHVAGTIAAAGKGSAVVGVAPSAQIMAVKGLDNFGSGFTDGLAQALVYAVDNGAQVINNSWGSLPSYVEFGQDFLLKEAIQYAVSRGVVVVFASGNAGSVLDGTVNPESGGDVVSVGALRRTTDPYAIDLPLYRAGGLQLARFSDRGHVVDVTSPGVAVLSSVGYVCDSYDPSTGDCTFDETGASTFAKFSGTSMAAPHVAGVAALIKAANPALSGAEIAAILRSSAQRSERTAGPDPLYGAGLVNAEQAVAAARRGRAPTVRISAPTSVITGTPSENLEVRGSIRNGLFYRATVYNYDNTFRNERIVLGTDLGVRTRIPTAQDGVLWSVPLRGLKTGRYALTLTVGGADGRTVSETVPFAVEGADVTTLSENSGLFDDLKCLSGKGDWVVWNESNLPLMFGFYPEIWNLTVIKVKAANLKSGERTTLYTFKGIEDDWRQPDYEDRSVSCPQILDDGNVVWLERVVKYKTLASSGVDAAVQTSLRRVNLTTKAMTTTALPGVPLPVEDIRRSSVGLSTNGSELLFLSEEPRFEDSGLTGEDGSKFYYIDGFTTRLHHLAAGSSAPTTVAVDGRLWFDVRMLAGPLSSREGVAFGARFTLGEVTNPDDGLFATTYSVPSGATSSPAWFTPTLREGFGYALFFDQPRGDLISLVNYVAPEDAPSWSESRIRPGISIMNLRSGFVFPVWFRGLIGYTGLSNTQLVWGGAEAKLLRFARIETLNLRSGARASRDPGFYPFVGQVAPTSQGIVAVTYFNSIKVNVYR